jgi:Brp/Blh family beta-carotene 15,15'-monooxygenase
MTRTSFVFFAAFYIAFAFIAGMEQVSHVHQTIGAAVLIGLVGIPHGAIDHIIFLEQKRSNPLFFYGFYFGLMALYIGAWLVIPVWCMAAFLALSAYHFGQSQFTELNKLPEKWKIALYSSWGVSILSALVYYNHAELLIIASNTPDIYALVDAFDLGVYSILLPVSTTIALAILGFAVFLGKMSAQRFGIEIYTLIFIHLSFYFLPLIIGFTLYFVILHSWKVLSEEFDYLKTIRGSFGLGKFVKLLAPYTILSLVGCALLMALSHFEIIGLSNILIAFILISALTLPHSIVMEDFYKRLLTRFPIGSNTNA